MGSKSEDVQMDAQNTPRYFRGTSPTLDNAPKHMGALTKKTFFEDYAIKFLEWAAIPSGIFGPTLKSLPTTPFQIL